MTDEQIREELLLWLTCFGRDWVNYESYSLVEHEFPDALEERGFLELNDAYEATKDEPYEMKLRITEQGMEFINKVNEVKESEFMKTHMTNEDRVRWLVDFGTDYIDSTRLAETWAVEELVWAICAENGDLFRDGAARYKLNVDKLKKESES